MQCAYHASNQFVYELFLVFKLLLRERFKCFPLCPRYYRRWCQLLMVCWLCANHHHLPLTWWPDYLITPSARLKDVNVHTRLFPVELSYEIDDTKSHGDGSFGKYWTGMLEQEGSMYFTTVRGWSLEYFNGDCFHTVSTLIIFVWSSYFHLNRCWCLRFPQDKYSHFTVCKHL